MISAIVFDVDDTLVYYENLTDEEWYREVCVPLCKDLGITLSLQDWKEIVSGKKERNFPERLGVETKKFWKILDKHNLSFRIKLSNQNRIKKFEDTAVLKDLRTKLIAYSTSSIACAMFSLNCVGLLNFFHSIYGKDLDDYKFIYEIKPKSGMLKEILRRESIEPDTCLVVGDSVNDYLSAIGAGCKALLIDRENKYLDYPKINSLEAILTYLHI